MTKKRRRPIHLHVMVSEEEQALIRERMAEAGIRNMGAYMRKMALNGYVLHVDLSPVQELVSLQRRCSNNLNQVAIQANTYGGIYPEEIKALHSENEKLKSKLAKEAMGDVMDQVQEVKGVKVLAVRADGVDMNGLRNLGDQLKEKLGEGVIVIASVLDGKVNLMATATDGAQKAGAHAGNLIKAIAGLVGGGGGGRPNMAQAGGKNPAGVDEALAKVAETVESQVR